MEWLDEALHSIVLFTCLIYRAIAQCNNRFTELCLQFFGWLGGREKHYAILTVLVACMSYQGIANLKHQWSIMGEFSNMQQEELVEWIKAKTPTSNYML